MAIDPNLPQYTPPIDDLSSQATSEASDVDASESPLPSTDPEWVALFERKKEYLLGLHESIRIARLNNSVDQDALIDESLAEKWNQYLDMPTLNPIHEQLKDSERSALRLLQRYYFKERDHATELYYLFRGRAEEKLEIIRKQEANYKRGCDLRGEPPLPRIIDPKNQTENWLKGTSSLEIKQRQETKECLKRVFSLLKSFSKWKEKDSNKNKNTLDFLVSSERAINSKPHNPSIHSLDHLVGLHYLLKTTDQFNYSLKLHHELAENIRNSTHFPDQVEDPQNQGEVNLHKEADDLANNLALLRKICRGAPFVLLEIEINDQNLSIMKDLWRGELNRYYSQSLRNYQICLESEGNASYTPGEDLKIYTTLKEHFMNRFPNENEETARYNHGTIFPAHLKTLDHTNGFLNSSEIEFRDAIIDEIEKLENHNELKDIINGVTGEPPTSKTTLGMKPKLWIHKRLPLLVDLLKCKNLTKYERSVVRNIFVDALRYKDDLKESLSEFKQDAHTFLDHLNTSKPITTPTGTEIDGETVKKYYSDVINTVGILQKLPDELESGFYTDRDEDLTNRISMFVTDMEEVIEDPSKKAQVEDILKFTREDYAKFRSFFWGKKDDGKLEINGKPLLKWMADQNIFANISKENNPLFYQLSKYGTALQQHQRLKELFVEQAKEEFGDDVLLNVLGSKESNAIDGSGSATLADHHANIVFTGDVNDKPEKDSLPASHMSYSKHQTDGSTFKRFLKASGLYRLHLSELLDNSKPEHKILKEVYGRTGNPASKEDIEKALKEKYFRSAKSLHFRSKQNLIENLVNGSGIQLYIGLRWVRSLILKSPGPEDLHKQWKKVFSGKEKKGLACSSFTIISTICALKDMEKEVRQDIIDYLKRNPPPASSDYSGLLEKLENKNNKDLFDWNKAYDQKGGVVNGRDPLAISPYGVHNFFKKKFASNVLPKTPVLQDFLSTKTVDNSEALISACKRGKERIAAFLLNKEMDPNLTTSDERKTPVLLLAVMNEHKEVARKLLEAGANVDATDSEGITPLHKAIFKNNMAMVKLLVENGAKLNTEPLRDDDERLKSIVSSAIDRDCKASIIKHLFRKEAVFLNKKQTYYALETAVKKKRHDLVKVLLEKCPNIDVKSSDFYPILSSSIGGQRHEILQTLVNAGADIVNCRDDQGKTLLMIAAQKSDHKSFRMLTGTYNELDQVEGNSEGSTLIKIMNVKDHDKKCLLDYAFEKGNNGIINDIVKNDLGMDLRNSKFQNALHLSAIHNKKDIVRLYVRSNTLLDSKDRDGHTALDLAHENKHKGIVGMMSRAMCNREEYEIPLDKLNSNYLEDLQESSVLHFYITQGCSEEQFDRFVFQAKTGTYQSENDAINNERGCAFEVHIEEVTLNKHDQEGDTPLHRASTHNGSFYRGNYYNGFYHKDNSFKLSKLIEAGADLNAINPTDGDTALHRAVVKGHPDITEKLIAAGANVNIVNKDGMTPLDLAFASDRTELIWPLLSSGAVSSIDSNSKSALQLFKIFQDKRVLRESDLITNPSELPHNEKFGLNSLHYATSAGLSNLVDILLKTSYRNSPEVNKSSNTHRRAIDFASLRGHKEILEQLLKANASTQSQSWYSKAHKKLSAEAEDWRKKGSYEKAADCLIEAARELPWEDYEQSEQSCDEFNMTAQAYDSIRRAKIGEPQDPPSDGSEEPLQIRSNSSSNNTTPQPSDSSESRTRKIINFGGAALALLMAGMWSVSSYMSTYTSEET